ncbi:MAG TPA: SDR family oxidoreductase [Thermodesulfobacteriota bacterium]|nr:SDR family oxidoreductase [Thermodesulfobacteriota bacterium]
MNVMQLFDLTGKVAIVTGGYTGIGRQMAEGLAEAGANLVICARNLDACIKTAEEIKKDTGVETLALRCDVSSESDVENMVKDTLKKFNRINILVNNSGIATGGLPEETKLEDWEGILKVNLTGMFLCSRETGKVMIKAKRGKIINIASIMGFVSTELVSAPAYVTSKGAALTLTRELAVRWIRHNINVNAIAPGWFPSNMTDPVLSADEMGLGEGLLKSIPARRFGNDDDLKGMTVLLASPASDYIVGQTFLVDGGASARY